MSGDRADAALPCIDEVVAAYSTSRWIELSGADHRFQRSVGLKRMTPLYVQAFPRVTAWQGRKSILFWLLRRVRSDPAIVALAIRALDDRATLVRQEACGLLAFALAEEALPALRGLAARDNGPAGKDASAAIDAITARNHHLFVDRNHTGNAFWKVRPVD